ncbi:hypothetical protein [Mumia sp. DW29H23]|uniref:hypothetical protein n=1 Tax=Mumia sp. DW29H23 TaxID=3421241 RepID=UPI003D681B65
MKNFPRKAALGVGVAALALTGAGAAYAAGTYVSIGGNPVAGKVPYTASNATPIAFNTNYGTTISCSMAYLAGDLYRGAEVKTGNTIGTLDSGALTCALPTLDLNVTITAGNIIVAADPVGPAADVPVTITGFHGHYQATVSGACTFDADGTLNAVLKAGNVGQDGILALTSATFSPETGFTLTISNVVGCLGVIFDDDLVGARDSNVIVGTPSLFTLDTTGVVSHG